MHRELQALWTDLPKDAPTELGAFIDVHALILSDPMISEAPLDIIRSRHYNAEWALVTQIDELSAQFDEIEDAYLRERKDDIQQVGERVLKVLIGTAPTLADLASSPDDEFQPQMIVVAHDISPADMLQFRDRAFAGFVTDLGGQNSHTAIVARSLDIPAAVGMSQRLGADRAGRLGHHRRRRRRGDRQPERRWCWSSTASARPAGARAQEAAAS